MKKVIIIIAMLVLPAVTGGREPELKTVEHVDLDRGSGTWYETARITHWYEKGLAGVTATYKALKNGKLDISTAWRKGALNGKQRTGRGKGKIADKKTNAKLRVSFFWPFHGDYWIIDLGPDYEYAVIGEPKRKCLWIFSRKPSMDPAVYQGILERLKAQGYDLTKLETTPQ